MKGQTSNGDAWVSGYADEVGDGEETDDEETALSKGEEGGSAAARVRKQVRRKTEKERQKRRANIQLEAQIRAQTRLTKAQRQALSALPSYNKELTKKSDISLSLLHKRKTQLAQQLSASGLAALKSGPARVPEKKQAYLLSEELPESLRELKMDGNLWNDWLDSNRRRGKVQMERGNGSRMRKKRGRGMKEIEKVQWRMFERE